MRNICRKCLREYDACNICEDLKYFAYRKYYCSKDCFILSLKEGDNLMRIQYDGKVWNVNAYDFKSGEYTLILNKKEFKVMESDELVQGYILTNKEYFELKYGKFNKTKPKQPVNKEELNIDKEL